MPSANLRLKWALSNSRWTLALLVNWIYVLSKVKKISSERPAPETCGMCAFLIDLNLTCNYQSRPILVCIWGGTILESKY